ncbi:MAG: alpha/beta fold hydrolase [Planctomycetes bacterium]|nr:alpha/beta fold hydrolase [Planctomycetota bacterium]
MVKRVGIAGVLLSLLLAGCRREDEGGAVLGVRSQGPAVPKSAYFTQTEDGWRIAVQRYTRSEGPAYAQPVILSGGALTSHFIFDVDPQHSLAQELARAGFDVWTFDIRGTGDSQSPKVSDIFGWTFSIDHFIKYDAPAVVQFVRQMTGALQVNWVGHGVGATMMFGYLERRDPAHVRNAVSIGGAGMVSDEDSLKSGLADFLFQIGTILLPLIPPNMPLPMKWAMDKLMGEDPWRWMGIATGLDSSAGRLFWNPEAMNPNQVYQFLRKALPNTSTNVVKQYLRWARDRRCVGNDGYDYTANLRQVTTPLCVLIGVSDQMVTPADSQFVYQRVSSTDKVYKVCGKATGHTVDFGHVDMLVGTKARAEVYQHVLDFLIPRSTSR